MLAGLGGTLGILAMVPLRRYLIVAEHGTLPYPEGIAAYAARHGFATAESATVVECVPRRAPTRYGAHDVPPHGVHAGTPSPLRLASDGAGLATQTLVQVEDHRKLTHETAANVR